MKPLHTRLLEARKRLGVPWEILERDYLLSRVLAGVDQVASLRNTLVFKGGTALRKCYFGDYRFSEDLDFSGLEGVPSGAAMERAVGEACDAAARLLDEYAPVVFVGGRTTNHETLEAFISFVNTHKWGSVDGILTYSFRDVDGGRTILAMDVEAQAKLPRVNGRKIDLTPKRTFDSPFLRSRGRRGVITIGTQGHRLILDFPNTEVR